MPAPVIFGTSTWLTTPERSSKFSGLPTRKGVATTGTGTGYPLLMEFDAMMRLFWRVKTVEVYTDLSVTAEGVTATLPSPSTLAANATSELQLPSLETRTHSYSASLNDGATWPNWSISINLEFIGGPTNVGYVDGDGGVYPYIRISGSARASSVDGNFAIINFDSVPSFSPMGSIVAFIEDEPITIYYEAAEDGFYTNTITFSSLVFAFTEFFPYVGTDGGAIYSTSTGELLSGRSPRS